LPEQRRVRLDKGCKLAARLSWTAVQPFTIVTQAQFACVSVPKSQPCQRVPTEEARHSMAYRRRAPRLRERGWCHQSCRAFIAGPVGFSRLSSRRGLGTWLSDVARRMRASAIKGILIDYVESPRCGTSAMSTRSTALPSTLCAGSTLRARSGANGPTRESKSRSSSCHESQSGSDGGSGSVHDPRCHLADAGRAGLIDSRSPLVEQLADDLARLLPARLPLSGGSVLRLQREVCMSVRAWRA
jgi:hypothetical protein